jgi:hypothetical protein
VSYKCGEKRKKKLTEAALDWTNDIKAGREDVAASLPFGRFPVRNGGLESRLRLALEPAALSAGRGPGGGGCAVAESRREVVSGAREPGALEEMDERG